MSYFLASTGKQEVHFQQYKMLQNMCKHLCSIYCFRTDTTNMCLTIIKNDCLAFVLHIMLLQKIPYSWRFTQGHFVMNFVWIIIHVVHKIHPPSQQNISITRKIF
jgi:hypothetical protein